MQKPLIEYFAHTAVQHVVLARGGLIGISVSVFGRISFWVGFLDTVEHQKNGRSRAYRVQTSMVLSYQGRPVTAKLHEEENVVF